MAKIQRKGSFESAGLKKTRLKNAKEEKVDLLFAGSLDEAITSVRTWIEECTASVGVKRNPQLSFSDFIDDGVVLCELVQCIRPGLVKKTSKVKSRFAYWENFTFFLKACKTLGLQDWQLFDPEELLGQNFVSGNSNNSKKASDRRVKNIVAILYWLALSLEGSPFFTGPKLDCRPFVNNYSSKDSNSPSTTVHSSFSSIDNSSPCRSPEHKLISVSTPCIEQQQQPAGSPVSPLPLGHRNSSPFSWVEKIQEKEELLSSDSQDLYRFSQSDVSDSYRVSSQHSLLTNTDTSNNTTTATTTTVSQEYPSSRKRKETLSVRVEAYNPPSAFNADLVFVQDSTSSSVFSPTAENQVSGGPFSPNHLSNTFDATDPIDDTGLIIDPLEFHSEVFIAGTDSQDSGPHFSSPRPDTTFHVNLTQTSQPDNLSISNTQLDDFVGASSELPVISEVTSNNSPIDTFHLHHNTSSTRQQAPNHIHSEYSYSQEYNDKQIHHIDTPSTEAAPFTEQTSSEQTIKEPYLNNSKPRTGGPPTVSSNRSRNSVTTATIDSSPTISNTSSNSSSTSVIVVGYSPRVNPNSSPLTRRSSAHIPTDSSTSTNNTVTEVKPVYRRYSSPQQRPGYKSLNTKTPSEVTNNHRLSESSSEGEVDMTAVSSRKQMNIIPSTDPLMSSSSIRGKEVGVALSNGLLMTNLHATFLPGERNHGIILERTLGPTSYPIVQSIKGDTPAHRCGVQSGDEITKVNDVSLFRVSIEESNALLDKAITQKKLSLSIHRDTLSNPKPFIQRHSVAAVTHHNGIPNDHTPTHQYSPSNNAGYTRLRSLSSGVDFKRVKSDALPKHQVASTYTVDESSDAVTTRTMPTDTQTSVNDEAEEELNRTLTSSVDGFDDKFSPSRSYELGKSKEAPAVIGGRSQDHPHPHSSSVLSHDQFRTRSPLDYLKDDDAFMSGGPGKSQSVTELSTISPVPLPVHTRDQSDTGITTYYKSHGRAKKTESLPGKIRAQSLNFKDSSSSNRSSVSTPSVGLGLQHMSIDDMPNASKLQIDQIWKEVEGSSCVVSPVEDSPPIAPQGDTLLHRTSLSAGIEENGVPIEPMHLDEGHSNEEETTQSSEISNNHGSQLPRRSSSHVNEKKGIESLLNTLRSLNEKVGTYEEEEEFKLLEILLQSSKFKKAKELHDNMRSLVIRAPEAPPPVVRRVLPSTHYVRHTFREDLPRPLPETEELRRLLRKPDIQSTLFCHDKVSTGDLYVPSTFFPRSAQDKEDIILTHSVLDVQATSLYTTEEAPLSRDIPCNRKENATIVYLQRTNRPLGCAIYKDGDSVFVSKILEGCDAEQSGAIREGDELLEVNGIALMGKGNEEIIGLMSGEAGKTVSFTLIPVHDDSGDLKYEEKYVRAHFNYNGMIDEEIPCKELSLNFMRGDILEVSNQDDPDWWQARKVFEDGGESLPGLIPARHLQQKREVLRESHVVQSVMEEKNRRRSILSKITRKGKKKKIYYNQGPLTRGAHSVGHEVATYEDVVKLLPDTNRRRPIILIGASSVGRRTLIKRLIECYPKHYSTVVAHITRPPHPGEVDGTDYHFVTREEMEKGIQDGRFLDYMEHKYAQSVAVTGVAISSVKEVMDRGRIPVMSLQPQALKVIGSSGLIPYVIFIAAPRVERLVMTRKVIFEKKKKLQGSLSVDYLDRAVRSFTEGELIDLYRKSQEINSEFSHYFDSVVVNDDLQIACDYLLEVARRIEEEPQWVSSSWVEEV